MFCPGRQLRPHHTRAQYPTPHSTVRLLSTALHTAIRQSSTANRLAGALSTAHRVARARRAYRHTRG
eukprot:3846783-Rhodomonas_salina.1